MDIKRPKFQSLQDFEEFIESNEYGKFNIRFQMDIYGEYYLLKIGPFWHSIIKEFGRADVYHDNQYSDFDDAAQDMLNIIDERVRRKNKKRRPIY